MTQDLPPARRRGALRLAGGLLAGALAGCTTRRRAFESYHYERDAPTDGLPATPWPTLGFDHRRSGYSPHSWLPARTNVDLFADVKQSNVTQPAFVDGTAYFGGRKPVDKGRERWFGPPGVVAVDGDGAGWSVGETDAMASPTVHGNAVFVTSAELTRGFDRRTGTLCWEYQTGSSHPTASPTVVDGTVYVVGERVVALAGRTGEVQWASDPIRFRGRGIAATEDGVFVTTGRDGSGAIYRFDPETGSTTWRTDLPVGVDVAPVLGQHVYVAAADGRLRALDASSGSQSWAQDLSGQSSAMPAVTDDTVYAVAEDGDDFRAFDAATGRIRWEFSFEAERALGPTVTQNAVHLPTSVDTGGFMYAIEPNTGIVQQFHQLPHRPTTSLVAGAGMGIIGGVSPSGNHNLYAFTYPRND